MNNLKIEARNVRGTVDLFEKKALLFNYIINQAWFIAEKYNFSRLELPIFEFAEVFKRTMGETSDVVNKEIYSFIDRSENELALRPEFTASVMRAIHSNKLLDDLPIKCFSSGPVFRYDRPQKCRQRQFNQINFEVIGIDNSYIDADVISMCIELLKILKIENTKIHINSIGTVETRIQYSEALKLYLHKYKDELSEDSKIRFDKSTLRILDSKNLHDQELLLDAPKIQEFYDLETQNFFHNTLQNLFDLNIEYFVDDKLVRGLDYYTHTVFEIITDELGTQGTIIAGGRYHNLSEFFGKRSIPCFGCAGGVERLMSVSKVRLEEKNKIAVLTLGEDAIHHANKIVQNYRSKNQICDLILGKENDLKKLLTRANKQKYNFVVIIGNDEVKNDQIIIKNLENGEQEYKKLSEIDN
jgi:histidyl-tRNA synthetase